MGSQGIRNNGENWTKILVLFFPKPGSGKKILSRKRHFCGYLM